jgi:hypothetical protein
VRVLLGLLQDKLETRVKIDSVSVNFTKFDVNLWGVDIEDRQQRKMLLTDRIAVKLDVNKLLHKKIEIESAWIDGLSAELYNPKDSASNFQFVIDAFKTDKPAPKDTTKREQLSFDIHRLRVSNTSLHYVTDNHQPRKNTGKPKRGFFDAGHLDIIARIDLTLNELTKYLTGHVRTSNFRLGQVIEMKDIGNVGCTADFTFDYSKPRTAIVRKRKGGKLPIGKVTVSNVSGSYKMVKFNNISATITSDGAVAEGLIVQRKKMADILCHFTFNNTDSIQKMKIKPGLRLRNMPWQRKGEENLTKQEKQAAKAARKAEKAARKEEKAKLKAEKKALKAEKKAQRKAEKEK